MDVWNSRALDVHKWSEHPEVTLFIDELWNEFAEAFPEHVATKRGKQPKTKPQNQFKVLILDLFVCWSEDNDQCIGVSRNVTEYLSVDSRYNKLHISKLIIKFSDQLTALGWIEFVNGSYNHEDPTKNRTSRIKPAQPLIDKFNEATFGIDVVRTAPSRECIILKLKTVDVNEVGEESSVNNEIEYEDTTETVRMRSDLMAYNDLLHRTHIDIRDLDKPIIERRVMTKHGPRIYWIKVTQANKFVRRIFSDASWDSHGRFYGGFWQQVDEETRSKIFIDHHETVEVDFKALHITLLYACFVGEPLAQGQDPYLLKSFRFSREDVDLQRGRIKRLVLQAINAKSRESAFRAFRNELKKGDPDKRLTDTELNNLLDTFINFHPKLEPYICRGMANDLMYIDGKITAGIINRLTALSIPVLTIHDSYIVKVQDYEALRIAMYQSALEVTGSDLYAVQELMPVFPNAPHSYSLEQYLSEISHYRISEGYEKRFKQWKIQH